MTLAQVESAAIHALLLVTQVRAPLGYSSVMRAADKPQGSEPAPVELTAAEIEELTTTD